MFSTDIRAFQSPPPPSNDLTGTISGPQLILTLTKIEMITAY